MTRMSSWLILAGRSGPCASSRRRVANQSAVGALVKRKSRPCLFASCLRLHAGAAIMQPPLPVQRLPDDVVKVISPRFPAKQAFCPLRLSDKGGGIPGPTR